MNRLLPLAAMIAACVSCKRDCPETPLAAPLSRQAIKTATFESRATSLGNLISNPGFEGGLDPWFIPKTPQWEAGQVSTVLARTGKGALLGPLRASKGFSDQKRWGALYEAGAVPFPRRVSLHYRVERWEPGNATQYLLFAILVGSGPQTRQIRYFLAGPEAIPYNSEGNTKFVLVKKGAPEIGAWIHFEADLIQDFQNLWGSVPRAYDWLRFAVEVRFETLDRPLDKDIAADVYFDDVFVGQSAP